MPITQACELATEKSKNWIALITIGGSILAGVIILAMIGLAFEVPEVAAFLDILHSTSTLYFIVTGGVILIVMGMYQRNVKQTFCGNAP